MTSNAACDGLFDFIFFNRKAMQMQNGRRQK